MSRERGYEVARLRGLAVWRLANRRETVTCALLSECPGLPPCVVSPLKRAKESRPRDVCRPLKRAHNVGEALVSPA
jgi:hypothetical protein